MRQKSNSSEKSQKPFSYARIEKLRQEAWDRPQVQRNWEEFHRKQNNTK